MNSDNISRFERAWEEAVKAERDSCWGRIRRLWRSIRSYYSGGKLPDYKPKKDDMVVRISPTQVMTRNGQILMIDPRCDKCKETFGE